MPAAGLTADTLVDGGYTETRILRAITVAPDGGPASVKDVPEPSPSQGAMLARTIALGVAPPLNRTLVLNNQVVFGTVNANRRHYEQVAVALAHTDRKMAGPADHAAGAARPLGGGVSGAAG
jgi:hypothetical protein